MKSLQRVATPSSDQRIRRLRSIVIGGWLALAIPAGYLTWYAQQQIKWEALYQTRTLADAYVQQIDSYLQQWIAREEMRAVAEFEFLYVASQNEKLGYLQRSPLSQWPVTDGLPGVLGYFQVDDKGRFTTPLLPEITSQALDWGISTSDVEARQQWNRQLHDILSENQLVSKRLEPSAPVAPPAALSSLGNFAGASALSEQQVADENDRLEPNYSQKAFDTLNQSASRQKNALPRVEELKLDKQFEHIEKKSEMAMADTKQKKMPAEQRPLRKEQSVGFAGVPLPQTSRPAPASEVPRPVKLFESEVDAYEFARLDSGHFVVFRNVWRSGQRWIQGALIDQEALMNGVIRQSYAQAPLAGLGELIVAFQGNLLSVIGRDLNLRAYASVESQKDPGTLLLQKNLSAPFSELQLVFSLQQWPAGPGARVVTFTSVILMLALLIVFYLFYRLGAKQIRLVQQQQNFVSAVSHELKTPLTSIRMFSEILREGWVTPDKQREYYTYISEESERLSRLIANVLQLARMERKENPLDIKPASLQALLDLIRSRCATQLERCSFHLQIELPNDAMESSLLVDTDAFLQIMLNLIDNALKFAAQAEKKQIDIRVEADADPLTVCVRDYGPGIPPADLGHIFDLFYRVGNELTRETNGTGIGLSLVRQLTAAMGGQVTAINRQPGAEFRLQLPLAQSFKSPQ